MSEAGGQGGGQLPPKKILVGQKAPSESAIRKRRQIAPSESAVKKRLQAVAAPRITTCPPRFLDFTACLQTGRL